MGRFRRRGKCQIQGKNKGTRIARSGGFERQGEPSEVSKAEVSESKAEVSESKAEVSESKADVVWKAEILKVVVWVDRRVSKWRS